MSTKELILEINKDFENLTAKQLERLQKLIKIMKIKPSSDSSINVGDLADIMVEHDNLLKKLAQ